jgi:hypothetical protein
VYGKKELQEHLRERLKVGSRRLNQLIAAKAQELPSTRDEALFVLAYENGLKLQDYLTAEQIASVRVLVQGRPVAPTPAKEDGSPAARGGRRPAAVTKNVTIGNVRIPPTALTSRHLDDAIRMAEVYPLLYTFENSVREFIDGHLADAYGPNWHDDPHIVRTGTRDKVERNRNSEAKTRYHSSRKARFIYYTDIGDLPLIAKSRNGVKVLQPLFPSESWFPSIVEKVEASRNVVAHMNPVTKRDIDRIRLNFEDWLEQVKDRQPPSVP